ncbi:hypothetical protein BD779DRAFT_1486702 [Infundibulicybe gibba]|nr:hypothetical protein BD779DRAFT_1486702 [Infundibulicybe gibba]
MSQQVLFKLNKRDGLTRRITFPTRPSWHALATRIETLYTIPRDKLGVSYIDSDQEEVTLSSEEELQDFYHVSHKPGEVIKFFVRDLTSSRDNKPGLDPSGFRNTFGQGSDSIFDAEWQYPTMADLGGIFISKPPESDHPHAFVEVVDSDISADLNDVRKSSAKNSDASSTISSRLPNTSNPVDKGKGKAMSTTGISSTGSVLGENAPPKHPVHVYDVANITQDTTAPIVAHSTPKPTPSYLTPPVHVTREVPSAQVVDDPPLASIDPVAPQRVPASLSNDGIRNIVRNASNGTYWAGQREAVSQAANDVGQAVDEIRRGVEEEASRKIAAAIDGMLRSLSEITGPTAGNPNHGEPWVPPSQPSRPTRRHSGMGTSISPRLVRCWTPSTNSYNESWMRGRQFPRSGLSSWQHPPPVPPPPMSAHGDHNPAFPNTPVAPREPPPPPPPPRPWLQPDLASSHIGQPAAEPLHPKPSPRELRAQVEAARLLYKAEKERYRQEREARRNEKGFSSGSAKRMQPAPNIVSNARGQYPQLEMVSVPPRRHNTHLGHSSARRVSNDPP